VLNRFIVPFGGLLRGRLAAGETLVVNGATGAYGTAAVLLGVAMGAAHVIAAGRSATGLEGVRRAGGLRERTCSRVGDVRYEHTAMHPRAPNNWPHVTAAPAVNADEVPQVELCGL
jgi:alcohol dehydrogenase